MVLRLALIALAALLLTVSRQTTGLAADTDPAKLSSAQLTSLEGAYKRALKKSTAMCYRRMSVIVMRAVDEKTGGRMYVFVANEHESWTLRLLPFPHVAGFLKGRERTEYSAAEIQALVARLTALSRENSVPAQVDTPQPAPPKPTPPTET